MTYVLLSLKMQMHLIFQPFNLTNRGRCENGGILQCTNQCHNRRTQKIIILRFFPFIVSPHNTTYILTNTQYCLHKYTNQLQENLPP